MTDNLLNRAEILIQQNRYEEADQVLCEILAQQPDNVHVLAMLADVQLRKGDIKGADELIDKAIALAPDMAYLHYVKATIATDADKYDKAEEHLQEAIALDPEDGDFMALLASIKLARKKYAEALSLADEALEQDPENLLALNTRSTALLKLNRKDESAEAIEGALQHDPDNDYTHANYGWGLLEKGDNKKALEHFREALSNNPNNMIAQAGMAEALKAKYWLYRLFLKYAFWIGNLTERYQWAVIVGYLFIVRGLRTVAKNNEALQPYLYPIIILLALVAFSTWVITPISNLFLRLNKYGKHLLDENEKTSSTFVAVSACVFLIGLLLYAFMSESLYLAIAAYGFTMMVPLSAMLSPTKRKRILVHYTIVMAIIGLISIGKTAATGEFFSGYTALYLLGLFGYQWVANYFLIKEDNI